MWGQPKRRVPTPAKPKYENPLFPERRKAERPERFFVFAGVCSLALFGTLAIRTPWLFLKEVRIEGLEYLNPAPLEAHAGQVLDRNKYLIIPERHRWFYEPKRLEKDLMTTYRLDEAKTTISSSAIEIKVREQPTGILFVDPGRAVFADLKGRLAREPNEEEKRLLADPAAKTPFITIHLDSPITSGMGSPIISEQFTAYFEKLRMSFEAETGLEVQSYAIAHERANWIKVQLKDQRMIYMDMSRESEPQIKKLTAFLAEKGRDTGAMSYIDVRYPNRIYYK